VTKPDEQDAHIRDAQSDRQHRSLWRLGLVGVIVGGVGSVATVAALFGFGSSGSDDHASDADTMAVATSPASVPGATAPISTTSAVRTPFEYLSALAPLAGTGNLTVLPRDFRKNPAYARAIAIQCPSNNSGDKVREVTYSLRGRYTEFTATVQPDFTAEPDSHAHVFAVAAYRETDGTLTRRPVGQQLGATGTLSAPITADLEGAVEFTLQVRCEHPQGVVIISDGQLTRTS
jgi:hypothetical protein